MAIAAAAAALTIFCVLAPMIGDPTGRLFALDTTSAIPTEDTALNAASSVQAFELTPTMLGPAITDEMLTFADEGWEQDGWEDASVLTMPELEVHAWPPSEPAEPAPPG